MAERIAIIGIGFSPLEPATPACSFKELVFETAQKAYADASVRFDEIDCFVTCAEDLNEGISIFDEYTPDQLGAVQKPMHTLTQDGLHGIADALMQIRSGIAEIVVVEAHSKGSNIQTPDWVLDYAVDPVYNRPLGFTPHAIAALEMNCFLTQSGITTDSPTLESRDWSQAEYARLSARSAYRQAAVKSTRDIDFFEVDDTYA